LKHLINQLKKYNIHVSKRAIALIHKAYEDDRYLLLDVVTVSGATIKIYILKDQDEAYLIPDTTQEVNDRCTLEEVKGLED